MNYKGNIKQLRFDLLSVYCIYMSYPVESQQHSCMFPVCSSFLATCTVIDSQKLMSISYKVTVKQCETKNPITVASETQFPHLASLTSTKMLKRS